MLEVSDNPLIVSILSPVAGYCKSRSFVYKSAISFSYLVHPALRRNDPKIGVSFLLFYV